MIAQNKLNPAKVSVTGTDPFDTSFSEEPEIQQKKKVSEGVMASKLYITMTNVEYFSLTSRP